MNEIRLKSIYAPDEALFYISSSYKPDNLNDIVKIIRFLSEDYKDLAPLLKAYYETPKTSWECLKTLAESYNKWVEEFRAANREKVAAELAGPALLKFLMQLIYNRAVLDPGKLNHYTAFSPQVYGETSFDLIDKLVKRITLKETDTFLDLGSG